MESTPGSDHSIPQHLRWLLERFDGAELRQTHVSFVVLTGDSVYKLKKPVRFEFIDLRGLEARKRCCEDEVRLNSRLCPDLYLGVVPIHMSNGKFSFDDKGEIVDYAVHMRRLSSEGMLDELVARDKVGLDVLGSIAGRIARFHAQADSSAEITARGGFSTLVENWRQNFEATSGMDEQICDRSTLGLLKKFVDRELRRLESMLLSREGEGRIRDGHGDLRCDAIWIDVSDVRNLCVFDCLEFDERYRFGDTGLDVAFLAMDLDARGRADLADLFVGLYCAASGDVTLPLVLRFYKCYRAFVRAKVRTYAASQPEIAGIDRDSAVSEARQLFHLAASYARDGASPFLAVVCGLTGSGKSVLAGTLAARSDAAILSTDVFRKQLMGVQPTESLAARFGQDAYADATTEKVYDSVLDRAATLLDQGFGVVFDGTFSRKNQRQAVFKLAESRDVPVLFVECRVSEEVTRQRQEARAGQGWVTSDATWETYLAQRQRMEPLDDVPSAAHVVIDTTLEPAAQIEMIGKAIERTAGRNL